MTKEQAIEEINKAFEPAFANYIITALTEDATVSDKALEQQPSDETIKYLECNDIDVQEFIKAMKRQPLQAVNPNSMQLIFEMMNRPTCDDCVSRQAVVEYIKASNAELGHDCENEDVREDILNMPPVTPTQRWISVSERLPKPNTAVLIYVSTGPSETFCLANWNDIQNGWEDWIGSKLIEKDRGYKVLAWQPLPKPYEEKRGDSDGSN